MWYAILADGLPAYTACGDDHRDGLLRALRCKYPGTRFTWCAVVVDARGEGATSAA